MFIKKIDIKNFRIFPSDKNFEIDNINIPNGNLGSGLTVLVGENGCGKTTILEALALPILEYKAESFSLKDLNDVNEKAEIRIYSGNPFNVDGTMPKGNFNAKGFSFLAGVRSRGNKSYLSSIVVSDQKFIACDPSKPKEDSPDLRISVNNPFKGKRFSENDIIFLDKNRLFQTRTGNFNSTRFDRLMEDFSLQYFRSLNGKIDDLNKEFFDKKIKENKIENSFLSEAVKKFKELAGSKVRLDFLDNCEPFKNAFFSIKQDSNQQISIGSLGSGYEMIYSIIYSFYLSKQSAKQLIILVDEPELHMHPTLQEKFVELLLEFSKDAQIIITSHSPLLIKQLSYNDLVKVLVVKKEGVSSVENRVLLPRISANETNYVAFGLATEEYHNELYEELHYKYGKYEESGEEKLKGIKKFDGDFFITEKCEQKTSPWLGYPNEVSIHTFIRNQIHHQKSNGKPNAQSLMSSINRMREFFITTK